MKSCFLNSRSPALTDSDPDSSPSVSWSLRLPLAKRRKVASAAITTAAVVTAIGSGTLAPRAAGLDHLPDRVFEHESRMLPAEGLVIDGDVVVLAAPDLHLGAHEEELLAADGAREAHQPRHLGLFQISRFRLRDVLHHVRDPDDGGRAPDTRGGSACRSRGGSRRRRG